MTVTATALILCCCAAAQAGKAGAPTHWRFRDSLAVDCGKKVSLLAPEHRTQRFDGVEGRDGKTATPLHFHRGHPVWASLYARSCHERGSLIA
jgi:hypothetical protein